MAVKAVRNITLALESNVRWYYFEAELTEEQYLAYLDNPDHFVLHSKMDLNWSTITIDEK